mmetsp:Transcript_25014/g.45861  ORF Transcript_25014/g.45861 Transcript_25014/m.45861 type:complete len:238 (-) Transcript_25014:2977-3690(-)
MERASLSNISLPLLCSCLLLRLLFDQIIARHREVAAARNGILERAHLRISNLRKTPCYPEACQCLAGMTELVQESRSSNVVQGKISLLAAVEVGEQRLRPADAILHILDKALGTFFMNCPNLLQQARRGWIPRWDDIGRLLARQQGFHDLVPTKVAYEPNWVQRKTISILNALDEEGTQIILVQVIPSLALRLLEPIPHHQILCIQLLRKQEVEALRAVPHGTRFASRLHSLLNQLN